MVGGSDFPDPIRRYTAGVSPRGRKLGKGLLEYRAGDGYPIPISIWGGEGFVQALERRCGVSVVRVFLRSRIESEFNIAEKVGKTVYRRREGGLVSKFLYTGRSIY